MHVTLLTDGAGELAASAASAAQEGEGRDVVDSEHSAELATRIALMSFDDERRGEKQRHLC